MRNKSFAIYGSYNDLIDQFSELMEQITGKNTELECSIQGEISVNLQGQNILYRDIKEMTPEQIEYIRAPHPTYLEDLSETDYLQWAEIVNQIENENNL